MFKSRSLASPPNSSAGDPAFAPLPSPHSKQPIAAACFHPKDLNEIADSLAPKTLPLPFVHPHRTIIFGNWDVTVLEVAVEKQGKTLKWHDERDSTFESLDLDACFGIVVNVKSVGPIANLFGARHWFALRKLEDGRWYNLDSKLPEPQLVAEQMAEDEEESATKDDATAVRKYLAKLQSENNAKVLMILQSSTDIKS